MADGKVVIDIEADSSDFKSEIGDLDDEAKKAANGMEDLGDAANDAADGMGAADIAIGTFIANGVSSLISAVGDAISSIVGLADATREYREDMAKLETAFATAGHSSETAAKSYKGMYRLFGESDRAVEAANHVAELANSTQDVDKWTTIAAGTMAVFSDSMPTETLTESARQTAELSKITGPLADAISDLGISEEDFNKQLAALNTEEERAALITETLYNGYQEAADGYNELTASTQDAREATMRMEEAQANLGAAIEPVTTAWTNLKAGALEWLVNTGLPVLRDGWQWVTDNLPTVGVAVGGLAAAFVAFQIAQLAATAATNGMTIAQYAAAAAQKLLNSTMLANPISLIILAITALVAAFVYLWNNCESFRNFWIDLWDKIKAKASEIWTGIVAVFKSAWEGIQAIWDLVSLYFEAIWETIKNIFAVVKAVLSGNFSEAWEAIRRIIDVWSGYFAQVWTLIKGVFAAVGSWFGEKFRAAYTAITNIWDSISGYFSGLYDDIMGAFDNIKESFSSVGSNIIDGIWNGLSAGWNWLKDKVKNLASSLFNAANEALDINSPSKVFMFTGSAIPEGIAKGIDQGWHFAEDELTGDLSGLTARVQNAVSVESSKVGASMGRADTGFTELAQAVGMQTAGINSLSAEYRRGGANKRPIILQLDKRELGRAIVDTGGIEETRRGTKIITGGAYA